MKYKFTTILAIITVLTGIISGCTNEQSETSAKAPTIVETPVSNNVTILVIKELRKIELLSQEEFIASAENKYELIYSTALSRAYMKSLIENVNTVLLHREKLFGMAMKNPEIKEEAVLELVKIISETPAPNAKKYSKHKVIQEHLAYLNQTYANHKEQLLKMLTESGITPPIGQAE